MATTRYRVYVEELKLENPNASHYYITIAPTICNGHTVGISAITEAAESLSHCEILHIAAAFRDGILFDHDAVCKLLELYAPDPKHACQWLELGRGVTVRPTLKQIRAMG